MNLMKFQLKKQISISQIKRLISSDKAELAKQGNSHAWVILAPCDGKISTLAVNKNQLVNSGSSILSIIPSDSNLIATLYAPSRAIGFLKIGQSVKLNVDAFPYQKFGTINGEIISVATSSIHQSEVSANTRLFPVSENNEPHFTVHVKLLNQDIDAYGIKKELIPGMQIDGDVKLDTRKLYEWVFEPIYSLRGK